jgi:hypothetical protein
LNVKNGFQNRGVAMTEFPLTNDIFMVATSIFNETKVHVFSFFGICFVLRLAIEALSFGNSSDYLEILKDSALASILLKAFIPMISFILLMTKNLSIYLNSRIDSSTIVKTNTVMEYIFWPIEKISAFSYSISYFFYCTFLSILVMSGAYIIFFTVMLKKRGFLNIFFSTILIISLWPLGWYFLNVVVAKFSTSDNMFINTVMLICAEISKPLIPIAATGYFFLRPITNTVAKIKSGFKQSTGSAKKIVYDIPKGGVKALGFSKEANAFDSLMKSSYSNVKQHAQSVAPYMVNSSTGKIKSIWKSANTGLEKRKFKKDLIADTSDSRLGEVNSLNDTYPRKVNLKEKLIKYTNIKTNSEPKIFQNKTNDNTGSKIGIKSTGIPHKSSIKPTNYNTSNRLTQWGSEFKITKSKAMAPDLQGQNSVRPGRMVQRIESIQNLNQHRPNPNLPLNTNVFKNNSIDENNLIHSSHKPKLIHTNKMTFEPVKLSSKNYGKNTWHYPGLFSDKHDSIKGV